MDITWPPLHNLLKDQGDNAIIKVEPRVVSGAGRGLFATQEVQPLETLVSIPGLLLLNAKTLNRIYPASILPRLTSESGTNSERLTSTQILSMHLYRVRRGIPDPSFNAYINTLPTSFSDHPLTVILENAQGRGILDHMPGSAAKMLLDVEKRLKDDWGVITKTLTVFPDLVPPGDVGINSESPSQFSDFIWAWLNVNTRCLYHQLGFVDSGNNITMCPLLDFANHTSSASISVTQDEFALLDGMAFSSAIMLRLDDEVYLRYGAHSNAVLFSEYGFVIPFNRDNTHIVDGEILIDPDVEELLQSSEYSEQKIQLLKDRNYWRDWTLHVEDGVARPSFRLLPALRLLHINLQLPSGVKVNRDLESWEDSLLGLAETVSSENETKTRQSIITLCSKIVNRAELYIQRVEAQLLQDGGESEGWRRVISMVQCLWEEELEVARRVRQAVLNGVEF
ncbi:SET domain-containing protein [Ceratobasidium sp. AG-I]|nr:SET domain-containing protein [Ceratobasidium sp. AG-I]